MVVIRPLASHTTRSNPGLPTCRAISAETIKIPDPIIEPATIMLASRRPRLLTRRECRVTAAPFADSISSDMISGPQHRAGRPNFKRRHSASHRDLVSGGILGCVNSQVNERRSCGGIGSAAAVGLLLAALRPTQDGLASSGDFVEPTDSRGVRGMLHDVGIRGRFRRDGPPGFDE